MESSYHLPDGTDELEDGILSIDGGVAWSEGQAYAWSPSKTWMSLPAPPSSIEDGFRTSEGILVGTESDELGFWGFGDGGWSWWQGKSELTFPSAYPPIGDYLVVGGQQGLDSPRLLVYRISRSGLKRRAVADDLPETLDFAFVHIPADMDASDETASPLVLLSGKTLYWRPLTDNANSFQTKTLSLEKEARWFTDGFPPPIGGSLSGDPPQVFGNTLILHRGMADLKTALAIDLEEGTVAATGLAPLGRSLAPWQAYAENRVGKIETLIDTLSALPPPSTDFLSDAAKLIDVVQEEKTVQAVLTNCGVWTPDSKSLREVSGDVMSADSPGGVFGDVLLSWRLWLGENQIDRALYRKIPSKIANHEICVEPLQVQVGMEACDRFFDELRGENPPQSKAGNFDYSDRAIRALFEPYGPKAAASVESGLTDEHTPVRVAACMAAGLTNSDSPSILRLLDREPTPASCLWPTRDDIPREALWSSLAHGAPEVRKAAAKTCGLLRLSGSAPHLQSLLHTTPLLQRENEDVRETSLEALRLIPEASSSVVQAIEDCVRSDPSGRIRSTAVRSLAPHCRGPSSLDVLIWILGDTASRVTDDVRYALLEHAEALSPEQYAELVDRWLLRYVGHRRSSDASPFGRSFPEELPGNLIGMRVLTEEMVDISARTVFLEDVELGDLSVTEETLQIAPTALLLAAVQAAVLEETPLQISSEEPSTETDDLDHELEEHLSQETYLSEIDDSTFNYASPAMQAAEIAVSVYEHDARLSRRLAAFVLSELGLPHEREESEETADYRPLYSRLRDLSGESPHEQCHRLVQELSGENGAGRLLGLYVLAALGEEEAEESLVAQFTTGRLDDVPITWSLLQETTPFSKCPESFAEGTILGPYISCERVPLARRWEAFQDLYPRFRAVGVDTDHISRDEWIPFFEECVGAEKLLSWHDRHGAALNLAWLDNQHGRPAGLWTERANSIDEVSNEERLDYIRDQIWTGNGEHWPEFWERWREEHGHWTFRMLADRGKAEAVSHIKAALEKEAIPQQPAAEALQAIKARIGS
jgi:hypothetical protein